MGEVGRSAFDDREGDSLLCVEAGDGAQEHLRVGMFGVCEDLFDGSLLYDGSRVHDDDLFADVFDDLEVVRDEDQAHL